MNSWRAMEAELVRLGEEAGLERSRARRWSVRALRVLAANRKLRREKALLEARVTVLEQRAEDGEWGAPCADAGCWCR